VQIIFASPVSLEYSDVRASEFLLYAELFGKQVNPKLDFKEYNVSTNKKSKIKKKIQNSRKPKTHFVIFFPFRKKNLNEIEKNNHTKHKKIRLKLLS
jgi:type IV secretory pathway TraG/TraD family ATPase VirD4